MNHLRVGVVAILVLVGLVVLPGCGDDDTTTTSTTAETGDKLPKLPAGWTEYVNRDGGYAIGVPPGWFGKRRGARTELLSPEQLAALSVTVDRTNEVLEVPLEQLASATISSGGLGLEEVQPGNPMKWGHHYDAVAVKATGIGGEANVNQNLLLVVIRREGIATFTVLAAVNAENHPRFYKDEIKEMIRSLRSRPIS
jgi:hypothetical protein